MTLDEILAITDPAQLFGTDEVKAKSKHARLLRTTHPDLHLGEETKAQEAFIHVNQLWVKLSNPSNDPPMSDNTIKTRKHEYKIREKIQQANSVVRYTATFDGGHEQATLVISTSPKMNNQLLNGYRNLKEVRKSIPEKYQFFFIPLIESFQVQQDGKKLAAVALEDFPDVYTLRQVKEDYPEGIDPKDMAWIYRRMLTALGNTHDAGYVHGAPHLDAVLIHPEAHGLILTNWQYSVQNNHPLILIDKAAKSYYPQSALEKKEVTSKLDLIISARTMLEVMNQKTAPPRLTRFLKGMAASPTDTAAEALMEFDILLSEIWGARSYHPFKMRRNA